MTILKGPGVLERARVVRNTVSLPSSSTRRTGRGWHAGAEAAEPGRRVSVEMASRLVAAARTEAVGLLEAARTEAATLVRVAEEEAAESQARAAATIAGAREAAARAIAAAKQEANRLLGQAQVELGRAQAEAAALREQAEARLVESGEVIATAAEARRLLAETQAVAADTLAAAETEAAAALVLARESGHAEGYAAGYAEGMAKARQELAQHLELAFGVAAKARVERQRLIAEAEPEIVRLALAVARKVIAREVEADPDILKGLVTRGLLKAAGTDRVRLRLHPVTIERLGAYLDALTARFADRGVDVVADRSVERAGAVIETRSGTVDVTTETQVAKIGQTMRALAGE